MRKSLKSQKNNGPEPDQGHLTLPPEMKLGDSFAKFSKT